MEQDEHVKVEVGVQSATLNSQNGGRFITWRIFSQQVSQKMPVASKRVPPVLLGWLLSL